MNQTCGMIHEGHICGESAVEHVDIPTPDGGFLRIYLCAYHYDLRDEIIDKHGNLPASRLPWDKFDD